MPALAGGDDLARMEREDPGGAERACLPAAVGARQRTRSVLDDREAGAAATVLIGSMSAQRPNACTGMIAAVRSVIGRFEQRRRRC